MNTTTNSAKFLSLVVFAVGLSCTGAIPKFFTTSVIEQQQSSLRHSHPLPSSNEALKILTSRHRFDLETKKSNIGTDGYPVANNIVPDLQVGCGDGLLVENTTPTSSVPKHKVFARKERKKRETSERKRRAYYAYTVRTPSSISYSIWKPSVYRIQRPYFIPIWGSQGRLPIYFPPQSVFLNPGFPLDNPPSKEYLPSLSTTQRITTTEETQTETDIADRLGEPIWDVRPASPITTTTTRPTGRPNRPNTSTFPPLVHNLHPESSVREKPPTTTVPPSATRPSFLTSEVPQTSASSAGISKCALAIINCCSASSKEVSGSCFERLGCPGPFWDRSPCESAFAREAIALALNYYQTK